MTQRTVVGASGWPSVSTDSTTQYMGIGTGSTTVVTTNQSDTYTYWRGAGTFSRLYVKARTNTRTTTTTASLYINGVAVISQPVLAGSLSVASEISTTVSVADGDTVTLGVTTGTGGGAFMPSYVVLQFETTGQIFTHCSCGGAQSNTIDLKYYPIWGQNVAQVESTIRVKALEPLTFSNLYANINGSTATNTTLFKSRKNGANGNLSISFAAATSGRNEDITNTDSVATGDTYNLMKTSGTSGTFPIIQMGVKMVGSTMGQTMIGGGGGSALSATSYSNFFAQSMRAGLGESSAEVAVPFALTLSKLTVSMTLPNPTVSTMNFRMRKNGAYGNQNVVIPNGSATPAFFQDLTNTDSYAPGDRAAVELSGISGTVAVGWWGALCMDDNASAVVTESFGNPFMLLGVS